VSQEITEKARQITQTLMDKMSVEARAEVEDSEHVMPSEEGEEGEGQVINIVGEDLGMLIGRRGQTLNTLQYLIRLMLAQKEDEFYPIVIDVNNYRQRRYESLRTMAFHMAEQVKDKKMPFSLEPMPAFDRRIVHMILADHTEVTTQSIGFGEERKVVIVLREE
jgi:spoIIIJ-associated protein